MEFHGSWTACCRSRLDGHDQSSRSAGSNREAFLSSGLCLLLVVFFFLITFNFFFFREKKNKNKSTMTKSLKCTRSLGCCIVSSLCAVNLAIALVYSLSVKNRISFSPGFYLPRLNLSQGVYRTLDGKIFRNTGKESLEINDAEQADVLKMCPKISSKLGESPRAPCTWYTTLKTCHYLFFDDMYSTSQKFEKFSLLLLFSTL